MSQSQPPPFTLDGGSASIAQDYQRWRNELGSFLTNFEWQLYATPSFKYPATFSRAKAAITEWVSAFGEQAFAYVAYEKGKAGGRTHAHVLLGGLVGEIAKAQAGRLWKHGNIEIAPYDSNRAAAWYVAKEPECGEFVGRLRRRTRRARGR